MKITEDLFSVESVVFAENTTDSFSVTLKPNMESPVLKAHFPGKPVVPGACLVGAACELIAAYVDGSWHLTTIKSVKYTSLIEPDDSTLIVMDFDVDKTTGKVKVVVSCDGVIATKMSLQCNGA